MAKNNASGFGKKAQGGFTLLDTIVAMLMIYIIIVAGLDVHVLVKRLHNQQTDMVRALYLAASEIEDLKYQNSLSSLNFQLDADPIVNPHSVAAGHTLFDRGSIPSGWTMTYIVTSRANTLPNNTQWNYKEVNVTCRYNQDPAREITLTGYVF
jgi:type II secretory pathway pseudopilin PulG